MLKKLLIGLLISMCATAAHAGAIERLKTFIAETHSAQANFTQEVLDQNGSAIPGLYAAGAITNWAYGEAFEVSGVKTWKGSYHAGMSQGLAIALVFGRIAGQEAGAVIHN